MKTTVCPPPEALSGERIEEAKQSASRLIADGWPFSYRAAQTTLALIRSRAEMAADLAANRATVLRLGQQVDAQQLELTAAHKRVAELEEELTPLRQPDPELEFASLKILVEVVGMLNGAYSMEATQKHAAELLRRAVAAAIAKSEGGKAK